MASRWAASSVVPIACIALFARYAVTSIDGATNAAVIPIRMTTMRISMSVMPRAARRSRLRE